MEKLKEKDKISQNGEAKKQTFEEKVFQLFDKLEKDLPVDEKNIENAKTMFLKKLGFVEIIKGLKDAD